MRRIAPAGYLALICLILAAMSGIAQTRPARGPVVVATIEGAIMPPTKEYVARALARAEREGAPALVVEMNTPGGRADSMREIAQIFLNARLPVIVYVAPAGAQAASAGAIVGLAAHLLAMAPGTNIGAAHPVVGSGEDIPGDMKTKVVNDISAFVRSVAEKRGKDPKLAEDIVRKSVSLSESEAVRQKFADLMAENREDLLKKLDGRRVATAAGEVTLKTSGAGFREEKPTWVESSLMFLLHPNVTMILWIIALYGIIAEVQNPGAIFPGVAGGIALILSLYAMSVLSVNAAGLALLVLSIALFVADIYTTSHGVLTVGGIIAFIVGGLMLVGDAVIGVRASLTVVITLALVTALFFGTIVAASWRAIRRPPGSGPEKLIGMQAEARTPVNPRGTVFADGTFWSAVNVGDEPIGAQDPVVVEGREGLTLKVRRTTHPQPEPVYARALPEQTPVEEG